MTVPASHQEFGDVLTQPDDRLDLGRACLLIARHEYPTLDVAHYQARLRALGDEARARLAGRDVEDAVAALNGYLFGEVGFRGNREAYLDPRNSFLNDVLDRRTGIPITLSTVYREVGRRAGLRVDGVGLPGHFVVRVEDRVLLDPFERGAVLSEADCQERLDRIYAGKVRLEPTMLAPCPPRAMLARMLRNLKAIYVRDKDQERLRWTLDLLVAAAPEDAGERRDRGLVYAALDCYGLAADDLEAYVREAPSAADAAEVLDMAASLRARSRRLN